MGVPADYRDRSKGPSAWPIYVAALVIAVMSLWPLEWVGPGASPFFALWGLFGFATAVGVALRSPLAWWCAVAWTIVFGTQWGLLFVWIPHWLWGGWDMVPVEAIVLVLGPVVVVAGALVTRRRLFLADG